VRKASLNVLAAGLALVVLTAGCTIGPDWLTSKFKFPGSDGIAKLDLSRPKDSAKVASTKPPDPSNDPTSLQSKATPSAKLHLAAAQAAERSGKDAEAEEQYKKALEVDPKHAESLVGYARLKDRRGQLDQATELYRKASQAHPNNASLLNDLGLCLARQKKYQESVAALERAIALEPRSWLYRNNAAMVLVETGQVDAAVSHLKAVQGESVAHYNVGYILQKKGDLAGARAHFAKALAINPSLAQAKIWLEELGSVAPSAPMYASQRRLDAGAAAVSDRPGAPPSAGSPAPTLLRPAPSQMPGTSASVRAIQGVPPAAGASRTVGGPSGPPLYDRSSRAAPLPPPSSYRPGTSGTGAVSGGVPAVLPLPPVGFPR
jgi:Tfp pilus assembly protein PilF